MIKIDKGNISIEGSGDQLLAEFGIIASALNDQDCDVFSKEMLNIAIDTALMLNEDTFHRVFGDLL